MTHIDSAHVIVVGTNYSTSAEIALQRAFELASRRADGEVHVLHVVPMPVAIAPDPVFSAIRPNANFTTLALHTERRLDEFNAQRPEQNPFVRVVCHLRISTIAEQIAKLAEELQAE